MPVRGGATIKARCPWPSGVSRSMTRVVMGSGPVSRRSQDSGLMGVSSSKVLTFAVLLGRHAVDVDDFAEPRALLPPARLDHAADEETLAQAELLDHAPGHEGIGQLAGVVCRRDRGGSRSRWDAFPARRRRAPGDRFRRFPARHRRCVADRRRSWEDAWAGCDRHDNPFHCAVPYLAYHGPVAGLVSFLPYSPPKENSFLER